MFIWCLSGIFWMHIFICCLSDVYLLFVWICALSVVFLYHTQLANTSNNPRSSSCATCRSVAKMCSCSAIDDVVGDRHANVCADVRVHLSLIWCVVSGCVVACVCCADLLRITHKRYLLHSIMLSTSSNQADKPNIRSSQIEQQINSR